MSAQVYYTGREELKSRLNITDSNSDYEIQLAIQAVANWINSYCVVPETPVLTADLRWVPAGELLVGDELVGFDVVAGGLTNTCLSGPITWTSL